MSPRQWLALAGLLLVSYAWFYQAGGWNQNSRFDLIRSLVEEGTIRIDSFAWNTGDKALAGGHVYSDKAPGQSFLAAPFVLLARPWVRSTVGVSYLATLVSSAVPAAMAGLLVAWIAIRLGASAGGSLFAALVYSLGTPAFAYATLLWGHALAAGALVGAFACALALDGGASTRRTWMLACALGLAAGWATVTEYQAAPAAVAIAALALARAGARDRRRLLTVAGGIAAGAVPCAVVLGAYDLAAFGSPFATPLGHLAYFEQVRESPFGFPSPATLGAILFGSERGLLLIAPVLIVAPVGFALGWRSRANRWPWIVAASIVVYYLLMNAAFRTPMAGWCYGPRYIAPALPFLCLGLAPVWPRAGGLGRALLGAAGAIGVTVGLMVVATTPQLPEIYDHPVADLALPAFLQGDLSLNHQSFVEFVADPYQLRGGRVQHDAWNLGERLGLERWWSLVPLLLLWALAARFLFAFRRDGPPPAASGAGTGT